MRRQQTSTAATTAASSTINVATSFRSIVLSLFSLALLSIALSSRLLAGIDHKVVTIKDNSRSRSDSHIESSSSSGIKSQKNHSQQQRRDNTASTIDAAIGGSENVGGGGGGEGGGKVVQEETILYTEDEHADAQVSHNDQQAKDDQTDDKKNEEYELMNEDDPTREKKEDKEAPVAEAAAADELSSPKNDDGRKESGDKTMAIDSDEKNETTKTKKSSDAQDSHHDDDEVKKNGTQTREIKDDKEPSPNGSEAEAEDAADESSSLKNDSKAEAADESSPLQNDDGGSKESDNETKKTSNDGKKTTKKSKKSSAARDSQVPQHEEQKKDDPTREEKKDEKEAEAENDGSSSSPKNAEGRNSDNVTTTIDSDKSKTTTKKKQTNHTDWTTTENATQQQQQQQLLHGEEQLVETYDFIKMMTRKKNSSFQMDVLCPGCRYESFDRYRGFSTCYKYIAGRVRQLMRKNNNNNMSLLLEESATLIATQKPEVCSMCHPKSCSKEEKRYYRLDHTAPTEVSSKLYFLKSIPTHYRLPSTALHNLTAYFSSSKDNIYPNRQYFFEYNPSIARLPAHQIPSHLKDKDATYITVFRVAYHQSCFHHDDYTIMMGGYPFPEDKSYLAVAVMDSNLDILDETVVDVKHSPRGKQFQDPRLFVLQNEQLYLATFKHIWPFWLVPPDDWDKTDSHIYQMETMADINRRSLKRQNAYEQSDQTLKVWMRDYYSCTVDQGTVKYGKNLNYFTDTTTGKAVLEIDPMHRKEYIDLDQPCNDPPPQELQNDPSLFVLDPNQRLQAPMPTFSTSDELFYAEHGMVERIYSMERGGHCCISVQDPRNDVGSNKIKNDTEHKHLLLGITHMRVLFKAKKLGLSEFMDGSTTHYFSNFYVMEPTAPYTVVARSGKLCFGNANWEEFEASGHPYYGLGNQQLNIGRRYDCAKIQFVSGMVEMANDSSKLILSYGINDCLSRFVTFEKADVMRMLFPSLNFSTSLSRPRRSTISKSTDIAKNSSGSIRNVFPVFENKTKTYQVTHSQSSSNVTNKRIEKKRARILRI